MTHGERMKERIMEAFRREYPKQATCIDIHDNGGYVKPVDHLGACMDYQLFASGYTCGSSALLADYWIDPSDGCIRAKPEHKKPQQNATDPDIQTITLQAKS